MTLRKLWTSSLRKNPWKFQGYVELRLNVLKGIAKMEQLSWNWQEEADTTLAFHMVA